MYIFIIIILAFGAGLLFWVSTDSVAYTWQDITWAFSCTPLIAFPHSMLPSAHSSLEWYRLAEPESLTLWMREVSVIHVPTGGALFWNRHISGTPHLSTLPLLWRVAAGISEINQSQRSPTRLLSSFLESLKGGVLGAGRSSCLHFIFEMCLQTW